MTQERMDANDSTKSISSGDYQAPDIESTLSRAKSTLSKIRVVNGANEQYFDSLEGKTVGSVRKSLREVFNIPGDASALISGKEVGDDFILEGGMNLEFVKEAGVKGAKQIFLRDVDSGEPAYYCGPADDFAEAMTGVYNIMEAIIQEGLDSESIDFRIEIKEMTDQEVLDLPDI